MPTEAEKNDIPELFHEWKLKSSIFITRWWFQIFFIFTPIWGRFPF